MGPSRPVLRGVGIALLLGLMSLTILILLLNLAEVDSYAGGSPEPLSEPDFPEAFPAEISPEIVCPCPCLHCHHRRKVLESRMEFRIVDRDGWYRLFWAEDDVFYFGSPVEFLRALENDTCSEPSGTWRVTIAFERECSHRYPAHDCSAAVPARVKLEFTSRIVLGPAPKIDLWTDATGQIRMPTRVLGVGLETPVAFQGQVLRQDIYIEWVLSGTPEVEFEPCRCR